MNNAVERPVKPGGAMLWLEEWRAWSARFSAARASLELLSRQPEWTPDKHATENWAIIPELIELFHLLVGFQRDFVRQLPPDANAALAKFIEAEHLRFSRDRSPNIGGGLLLVALLAKVAAQLDYFLSDKQVRARRSVERAFTHLQRCIVADEDIQRKWQRAFSVTSGRIEDACEKLGAVHLLLHGIWAFKADTVGGKTDLVLGEPVREEDALRAADAMVLTEWKIVREGDDPTRKALEAFSQAELYTSGPLAGFELSSHRYLVLVSKDQLTPLPTVPSTSERIYEVRNIAVEPSSPSVVARAAAGRLPRDR
ncbi:hypothetical protein [Pyxidicoccus xibeiensis]|uniref:hypothetical protein n=1 Tax=Pyxidicoccus xibeiensis TaxID=2906759 RepID=UPI0020A825F7|nr:hypothetical protein [Pyxidicoccus xibeiensis]MCP3144552.1 hypothetical protein [Pyxidicoccus xibeiensis]